MSSKVAYTVYSYPPPNFIGEGDLGTAVYNNGTSGDVITESKGVVTTWVNPVTSNTEKLPGDTKVFFTLYSGEVAPSVQLRGYVAPAFASVSAAALLERKRLLEEVAAAKK